MSQGAGPEGAVWLEGQQWQGRREARRVQAHPARGHLDLLEGIPDWRY